MSITPMDLDSSLDDLIKKRRQTKPHSQSKKQSQPHFKSNSNSNNSHHGKYKQQQQQQPIKSRLSVQTKSKISKPTQPQRTGINSRLSTSSTIKPTGPLFTSKNQPQQSQPQHIQQQHKRADPSQIIITKAFAPGSVQSRLGGGGSGVISSNRLNTNNNNNNNSSSSSVSSSNIRNNTESSLLRGRLGTQSTQPPVKPYETSFYKRSANAKAAAAAAPSSSSGFSNFSIRGRSKEVTAATGYSIKGESGPTTVLVSGLDPGVNSDDIRFSFEIFGNVLNCELLRSRNGRSFCEAEVEFSTKEAALDCIAKLDNTMADGQFLRIILREKSKMAPKALQSVISTTHYPPSGKLYSDQISTSRYDIRRQ